MNSQKLVLNRSFKIENLLLFFLLGFLIFSTQSSKFVLAKSQPSTQEDQKQQLKTKLKKHINLYYQSPQKREELYYILKKLSSRVFKTPEKNQLKDFIVWEIKATKYYNLFQQLNLGSSNFDSPPPRCMKYFNQFDQIWIQQNFPPELIIATWYRENSCKSTNPSNNHFGIFQLNNGKYYTPGKTLTTGEILEQARDFIDFSKHKRDYYARVKKLHPKFGKDKIDISYLHYTLLDLQLHAVTYNGITKWTHPTTNLYANANLHPDKKQTKDWVVTMTLKVLKYLKNHTTKS